MQRHWNRLVTINGKPGSSSSEYTSWTCMKFRCYYPTYKTYHRYGGRGIKVCDEWLHDFNKFYKDMGPKPTPKHTIDRIDNDKNYEPSNCTWSDNVAQQNNKDTPPARGSVFYMADRDRWKWQLVIRGKHVKSRNFKTQEEALAYKSSL